jgi:hypothetical protein
MDRSDAENEGVWKWVTGPRNTLEGLVGGSTFPDYFFGNANEPNQYNGAQEDYAHITWCWRPVLGMT